MSDRAQVDRQIGDYADSELRAVLATMISLPADVVCMVAAVVVIHEPGGQHSMRVLADGAYTGKRVADLLRHTADHCHGGCAPCRRRNRKAERNG